MAEDRSRVGDVVESVTRVGERMTWLDRPSYRLEHVMALGSPLFGGASDRVWNALNGTYVGHPVQLALTARPVGAWSVALVRRAGMVHGIVNGAALCLCATSWRDRHQGRQGRARLFSSLGYGLTVAGSFLGGNLAYRHQVGLDHSTNELGRPSS